MSFTADAQALASKGDTIGLERLLDAAAQARVEHRPDMPRTSEFLCAERLLDQLKRKGDAA